MHRPDRVGIVVGAALIAIGLVGLGWVAGQSALQFKAYERTVTVKGLSEREAPADTVIWPIDFRVAGNDLSALYSELDRVADEIRRYLIDAGVPSEDISNGAPAITDKWAESWNSADRAEFRYTAGQTVTVFSREVQTARAAMAGLSELGRQGVVLSGNGMQAEYLFSGLNDIKPEMIEEATRKAREVADKFAQDSDSRLGKIRRASQGRFSISPRDANNPQIKRIRVVSTVEYYLVD